MKNKKKLLKYFLKIIKKGLSNHNVMIGNPVQVEFTIAENTPMTNSFRILPEYLGGLNDTMHEVNCGIYSARAGGSIAGLTASTKMMPDPFCDPMTFLVFFCFCFSKSHFF